MSDDNKPKLGMRAPLGLNKAVEVGKVIHELVSASSISCKNLLEAADEGRVRPVTDGRAYGVALSNAGPGDLVRVIQL